MVGGSAKRREVWRAEQDILSVALDAGYGSHEAFTRAFREQFGLTPEGLCAQGNLKNVKVLEPMKMEESLRTTGPVVRFESGKVLLIAGISCRYNCETSAAILSQWQDFFPHIRNVPGQVGKAAFGVRFNSDDEGNFDYLCGVEAREWSRPSSDYAHVRIGPQKYAVFSHSDHISAIRSTWITIWNKWLPEFSPPRDDSSEIPRLRRALELGGRDGIRPRVASRAV